ncbi:hypothetical protein EDI_125130 [Entamoeba dispar SAW760]|uniref:JAB1/MPN/MOV34 metalloenzyme domain-containing protein n=1 Tax=Entamoeba dispar (strain ATCC PRA-260 / SAW760) TaxID=370354 RepID=B0EC39_ENTDS|nr:uncharacterized protein EDI_125130 [Entamoeba dispar SAW760]EDR27887.1 hypothetical protein EDI_125130 [Entamoeba dispar SAW760]|eukprot:EDR27887.1 hypothetical protein EDI_125130 [Entamoeba dispar SAW760]
MSSFNTCRILPSVATKLIDICNRLKGDNVVGLLSGHRSFGEIFDVMDVIPISTNPNCQIDPEEIMKTISSHIKVFDEEMIIGYFQVSSNLPKPQITNLHKFFNEAQKIPLFIAAGCESTFKIVAYTSTLPTEDKSVEFSTIGITYPIDALDRIVLATPVEIIKN